MTLTAVTEAEEERDSVIIDMPNAFIQTKVNQEPEDERIMIKTYGTSVVILMESDPVTHKDVIVEQTYGHDKWRL